MTGTGTPEVQWSLKPLRITKGSHTHRIGPLSLSFIISDCLVDMNVFAGFDKIQSKTCQNIKKTKRNGLTDWRENSIPAHKHSLQEV